ncbi:hypothetical protein [Streptomyces sp. HC307]
MVERAHSVDARVVFVADELSKAYGDRVDSVLLAPYTVPRN